MFWKRKPASEDGPAAGSTAGLAADTPVAGAAPYAEAALDTVVGMLRAIGRYAFDVAGVDAPAFRQRCEAWAEHLAIGAPHPGGPSADESRDPAERDFAGARQFVLQRRQDECDYLARSVGDLREVIADLTQRLATTLVDDQSTDRQVAEQIERLRDTAMATSLDVLKRDVMTVAINWPP
jgi:hypothetical protein